MRQTALNMVHEFAKENEQVLFLGSDLGVNVLAKFKAEFPERFIMEGVSEGHIIGMAAGLAMEGFIPYFNTIATFLSRRCYEQVVIDLCLHNLPVRLISSGGGLVYAPLGPTHLAIEDIAILRTLPNLSIVAPADATEMERVMRATVLHPGPIYIRLAKGGDPIVTSPESSGAIGTGIPVQRGSDVLLVTTGITLGAAKTAAAALAEESLSVGILHLPWIKPLDETLLLEMAKSPRIIVTVEEGVVEGLGSAVIETLAEASALNGKKIRRIGIRSEFPHNYGTQETLLNAFSINVEGIISTVKTLLNEK